MGVEARIVLFAADESHGRAAATRAMDRLAALDAVMSDYRPDSELMRFCAHEPGKWVALSDDLTRALARGQAFAEASGGAFDVTAGPIVQLWRAARMEKKLPAQREIDAALTRVGWQKLEIDAARNRARLKIPGMQLDLGGVGKGFAVNEAGKTLRAVGVHRYLVALAGDIALGDKPPESEGWAITLDPGWNDGAQRLRTMQLHNCGISTSGESMQFMELNGKTYSHIIDPRNGKPIERQRAITVIAPDATTSDALATTLNVLSDDEARELLACFRNDKVFVQAREDAGWRAVAAP